MSYVSARPHAISHITYDNWMFNNMSRCGQQVSFLTTTSDDRLKQIFNETGMPTAINKMNDTINDRANKFEYFNKLIIY